MGISFIFPFAFCISSFLSYFPVVMYGCKSWTIKKAEHRRIDAFELWCWRRLFWVLWTARRSNQSILKEISLEYSLEGLMLKLKLQSFDHLIWRTDSLEKTLMLGKIEGRRRRERQRMRWLDGITDSMDMSWVNSGSWWWTGRPGVLWFMGSQRVGHDWATELNWIMYSVFISCFIAKSLQWCPTLCDPIDSSPPGFPVPGILQARTLEWVAISFSKAWKWKVKVKLLSADRLLGTPWTAAYQAPPPTGFFRQEYWSGVPFWSLSGSEFSFMETLMFLLW